MREGAGEGRGQGGLGRNKPHQPRTRTPVTPQGGPCRLHDGPERLLPEETSAGASLPHTRDTAKGSRGRDMERAGGRGEGDRTTNGETGTQGQAENTVVAGGVVLENPGWKP